MEIEKLKQVGAQQIASYITEQYEYDLSQIAFRARQIDKRERIKSYAEQRMAIMTKLGNLVLATEYTQDIKDKSYPNRRYDTRDEKGKKYLESNNIIQRITPEIRIGESCEGEVDLFALITQSSRVKKILYPSLFRRGNEIFEPERSEEIKVNLFTKRDGLISNSVEDYSIYIPEEEENFLNGLTKELPYTLDFIYSDRFENLENHIKKGNDIIEIISSSIAHYGVNENNQDARTD